MEYILNKLPVKTTNNFKINDLKIDLDIPSDFTFKDYSISSDLIDVKTSIIEDNITSKIGLSFSKYLDVCIIIPENLNIFEPVIFTYNFSSDNLVEKIRINYLENSNCNIIFKYTGSGFHYLVEEVNMSSNSCGRISFINMMDSNSTNMMAFNNKILDNSDIINNLIDLSGNIRIYNLDNENIGVSGKSLFNNIYIGKDNNIIDMNYYVKNCGVKSVNKIVVEGVLDDNSHKNFRGTIDFIKGCIDSIGEEKENCVLLSDTAVSRSLPMMLCEEENVSGSHGESSGSINNDKLFYLMSRGLSKVEAEKFLVLANFYKIINQIECESIIEEVISYIESII